MSFTRKALTGERTRRFAAKGYHNADPSPFAGLHAILDELIFIYFEADKSALSPEAFSSSLRDFAALADHHESRGTEGNGRAFHRDPEAPVDTAIEPRRFGAIDGEWLTFSSGWEPHVDAPGRERWCTSEAGSDENATVHVGLRRQSEPGRPWVVLVHPSDSGRPELDTRIFRVETLADELGLNVAMPILPHHGPRSGGPEGERGSFLNLDISTNFHGLSQSVWDVRRTIAWIRDQGATDVSVHGYSLGGYVASMLVGLDPDLASVVISCPATDFARLFTRHLGTTVEPDEAADLYQRARAAYAPVDPLELEPLVPRERILLLGAMADRFADPVDQLLPLWNHLGEPELEFFNAGHISYMLSKKASAAAHDSIRARPALAAS